MLDKNAYYVDKLKLYDTLDDSKKLDIKSVLTYANTLLSNSSITDNNDYLKAILYLITSSDYLEYKTFMTTSLSVFEYFQNTTVENANITDKDANDLLNEEILVLKSYKSDEGKLKKEAKVKLMTLNDRISSYIKEYDEAHKEWAYFIFLPLTNDSLENLLNKTNKINNFDISRFEFYHPLIFIILALIINSKLLSFLSYTNELDKDYYLSQIRILLCSLFLINAINYSKGQFSLLTKAQLYFTYEIIRIFINNIKDNENFNLDNIKNIFTFPPTRNKTIPQLPNSQLAKRLNCLLFGYLVKSCYCLDNECDVNKGTIKSLIKSCKYREENKELSQSYTVCNCRKYSSGSEFCEFYNIVNQWLQDYEPIDIELKQTELIYFFDLDIDPAALNRYLKGNTKKVSPSFLNDFSVKTGIPKKYLTDKNKDTVHGLNMFYYKLNFLTLISVQDICLFRKQFSQYFKDWSKNPTPKRNESSEGTDIKTYLNKADMNIIYTVLKVLNEKPHLKDIQIYKKTADKIEYLLKEANKTF